MKSKKRVLILKISVFKSLLLKVCAVFLLCLISVGLSLTDSFDDHFDHRLAYMNPSYDMLRGRAYKNTVNQARFAVPSFLALPVAMAGNKSLFVALQTSFY